MDNVDDLPDPEADFGPDAEELKIETLSVQELNQEILARKMASGGIRDELRHDKNIGYPMGHGARAELSEEMIGLENEIHTLTYRRQNLLAAEQAAHEPIEKLRPTKSKAQINMELRREEFARTRRVAAAAQYAILGKPPPTSEVLFVRTMLTTHGKDEVDRVWAAAKELYIAEPAWNELDAETRWLE